MSMGGASDRLLGELLGVELDDELLAHGHVDLLAQRQVAHGRLELAGADLEPLRHGAVERVDVVADARSSSAPSAPISTTSPLRTLYDGIVTRLPLTCTWPWRTNWRAWLRLAAKPARNTTLSRRCSSIRSRFSPVMPGCLFALA